MYLRMAVGALLALTWQFVYMGSASAWSFDQVWRATLERPEELADVLGIPFEVCTLPDQQIVAIDRVAAWIVGRQRNDSLIAVDWGDGAKEPSNDNVIAHHYRSSRIKPMRVAVLMQDKLIMYIDNERELMCGSKRLKYMLPKNRCQGVVAVTKSLKDEAWYFIG